MERTFEEVKQFIINDIRDRTNQLLNRLIALWSETYESNICVSNAEQLPRHVAIFYDDLIAESKSYQEKIHEDISQLYAEAYHLKTLLTSDIDVSPDIPLHSRKVYLTDCVSKLKTELEIRQNKIKLLLNEQKVLCCELEEYPRPLNNGPVLPTQDDLIEFRQYLDDLIVEKHARFEKFTKLRCDINDLLMKMKKYYLGNSDDLAILNDPNPLTKKNLTNLTNVRNAITNQYNSMRADIDKMTIKLKTLWNCIGLDDDHLKKQFEVIEYDYETFNRIAQEVIKPEWQAKIKEKVIAVRQEISDWWNKMLYSESERAEFSSFKSNIFTAELLSAHETELERLKELYSKNEKIYSLLDERQQLLTRLQNYDEKSKDPSRLRNRGGQLLQDEKNKKLISIGLGHIEMEILVLAEAYYKSTDKPFTANGISIDKFMVKERKANKELNPKRRTTIDVPSAAQRTPVVKRHLATIKRNVSNLRLASGSGLSNRLIVPNNLVRGNAVRRIMLSPNPRPRKTTTKASHLTGKRGSITLRKSLERRIATGRIDKARIQTINSVGMSGVPGTSIQS